MHLTEHFRLEELTRSDVAQRRGIDNHAGLEIITHLTQLALGLEKIRQALGDKPLRISSGYRCPELNRAVGGAKLSAHMDGYAADFTCPDFGTPLEIVRALTKSNIQFDKLIQEGTWVHVSFAPAARRHGLS